MDSERTQKIHVVLFSLQYVVCLPSCRAWLLKVNSSSDLPIVPSFLPVSSDVARVGRNPAICQLSLDGLGLDEQNFAAASQSHFTLYRWTKYCLCHVPTSVYRGFNGRPYLVDTSSNGTWVNGEQVRQLSLTTLPLI